MRISLTRADGLLIELDNWNGKKVSPDSVPPTTFLSWKDVAALELERRGYEVVRKTARDLGKHRKQPES